MGPAHTFESVSRRPPDVEDYIDMLRRYRSWIIGPTFAGLVLATVVAFLWPDTYISTAVMRITPQQVPDKLVPAVITTQMTERLQQLQTEILSRTSLAEIIQKPSLDLYKRERARLPMEDIVQDMRNKYIKIIPISDVNGAGGGRRFSSAFGISFAYIDRYKAQAVVRELVTKFTETNVTVQRNQASLTTTFLKDELKSSKDRMDKLDEDIIKFKQANMGRLPEQASANSQALQTYNLQLMNTNQQFSRISQEKMLLESDLKNYKNQEVAASANLTETVAGTTSAPVATQNPRLASINATVTALRTELASRKQKFGPNHPDVADAEAQLQMVEKERDDLEKREAAQFVTPGSTTPSRVVTNPAVQRQIETLRADQESVRSRLQAKEMEIQELNRQRAELERQIGNYQARIESAPLNEQQYNAMIREFNLAKQEYEDMVKRTTLRRPRRASKNTRRARTSKSSTPRRCPS
ncbi:MAG TPA: hypothetical protein VF889_00800, partial [Bacteroidota bacterium]